MLVGNLQREHLSHARCWGQLSPLHSFTALTLSASPLQLTILGMNKLSAKYSWIFLLRVLYFSAVCSSLCLILLHQLFRLIQTGFASLQATFCSQFLVGVPSFLCSAFLSSPYVCLSLLSTFFSLSTWLAVICQIPPWRLLCLNQSELTSFRLICTLGDWFSSLGIIWCSIPSLPEQIKL